MGHKTRVAKEWLNKGGKGVAEQGWQNKGGKGVAFLCKHKPLFLYSPQSKNALAGGSLIQKKDTVKSLVVWKCADVFRRVC